MQERRCCENNSLSKWGRFGLVICTVHKSALVVVIILGPVRPDPSSTEEQGSNSYI